MQNIIPLIARCLIALMFLVSGINNAMNLSAVAAPLASKGIAMPEFFAAAATAFLIIGSLLVIFGYKAKVGALLLLIFLVPTSFIFHLNIHDFQQMMSFLRNGGLAAALLFILAYGPGGLSFDARSQKQ